MVAWIGSLLVVPIAEYIQGPTPQSKLIQKLGTVAAVAAAAWGVLALLLQHIGILPAAKTDVPIVNRAPGFKIRNFAIWIVIALLLVFLFNLFQGQNGPTPAPAPAPNNGAPSLEAILINWFPMLLLIGVWIFIMRRMMVKKNDEDPKA